MTPAHPGQTAALALAAATLAMLLVVGFYGTLFGSVVAAREMQRVPAALAGVALLVLVAGPARLPAAAGWAILGAALAVLGRAAFGRLGTEGWMPSEDMARPEMLAEAGWLIAFAVLAWRGAPPALVGPALAAAVATTRLGGYGQVLVPVLWEETLRDSLLVGTSIVAGFAAGVFVLLLAGWALAILLRLAERRIAPGRLLAGFALAAAIGHMSLS